MSEKNIASTGNNSDDLPKGWIETKLDAVCTVNSGIGFPKIYQGGKKEKYSFYKVGDISKTVRNNCLWLNESDNYVSQEICDLLKGKLFPKGTIVFAKIGEALKLNRRAISSTDSLFDNNVMGLISNESVIEILYLYYFFITIKLGNLSRSTTVPSIRKTDVESIPIPIPPLNEQKRIVSKIESIFAQIDAIRENLERLASQVTSASGSLVQLKSSVLKQAFEGRILPQDPNDEPAEILLKRIHKDSVKELFFEKDDLPKGWIRTDLENISTVILGQSPPSSTYNKEGSGLPFFQGKADFGEFYPTTRVWCDSPKKTAEKNDILISVRAPVGSTNISPETCCIGRGLSAIKTLEVADMSYVFYHLRYLENHISQKGTGTTFKAITGKQLKSIKVSLPPLLEQHRIVSKIESIFGRIDAIEKQVDDSLTKLDQLKKSTLKKAFEGKLVPQDPSDEPAEILLQKIKQQKEQLIQNQKPSKRKKIVK